MPIGDDALLNTRSIDIMVSLLLVMPSDDRLRITWLERQLVDVHLHQLVTELLLIRSFVTESAGTVSLSCLLGCKTAELLSRGLRSLTPNQFTKLLQCPQLLLPLQELVLVHGGDYWQCLCQTVANEKRLDNRIAQPKHSRWTIAAIFAIAATLLIGVTFRHAVNQRPMASNASTWGPGRIATLSETSLSTDEYFNLLADAADQWYDKRPSDEQGLIRRADQFVQGCQTLIMLPHPSLPPHRRQYLRDICRRCQTEIEGEILSLQQQKTTFALAMVAIDESIDRLSAAMRS